MASLSDGMIPVSIRPARLFWRHACDNSVGIDEPLLLGS